MKDDLYSRLSRRGIEINPFSENDPDFDWRTASSVAVVVVPFVVVSGWWQIYTLFFG